MSGTVAGGIKAREIFYEKYGRDYFKNIGRKGGEVCNPYKGFGSSQERAKRAGSIGGKLSGKCVKLRKTVRKFSTYSKHIQI